MQMGIQAGHSRRRLSQGYRRLCPWISGVGMVLLSAVACALPVMEQASAFMRAWPLSQTAHGQWGREVKSLFKAHEKKTRYVLPHHFGGFIAEDQLLWHVRVSPPTEAAPTQADRQDLDRALAAMDRAAGIPNALAWSDNTPGIHLFSGRVGSCTQPQHLPLEKSCCAWHIKRHGVHINHCPERAYALAAARRARRTHFVGQYCMTYWGLGPARVCMARKKVFCLFSSLLAKRVQVQFHRQHHRTWGTARQPDCQGLNAAQIQQIDWPALSLLSAAQSAHWSQQKAKYWQRSIIDHLPQRVQAIQDRRKVRVLHPNQTGGWQVSVFPLEGQGPFDVWVCIPAYYNGTPIETVSVFWGEGGRRHQRHFSEAHHEAGKLFWRLHHRYAMPLSKNQLEHIRITAQTARGALTTHLQVLNYWNEPDNHHIEGGGHADETEWHALSRIDPGVIARENVVEK